MPNSVVHAQKMIHDLLGSGLLMKDIIVGSGVNPTTLGWIRKGRVEKISGKTFGRIQAYWTKVGCKQPTLPVLKGEKIDHASQMVQQLVEKGFDIPKISQDLEIVSQTLKKLQNGDARRILDPTYDRLRAYWRTMMRSEGPYEGLVSYQHVPVDMTVINRLIESFGAAKEELEGIRKEIGRVV